MKPTTTIQARKGLQAPKTVRKVLLICGILSSLLYVGADILAAMQWEGYSYTSQAVSELGALGSPTRPLLFVLFSIYDALVIAFGLGLLATGSRKRTLRITGILLIIYAIVGRVTFIFFPLHLRGVEATISDTMHGILSAVNIVFMMMSIGFGAAANGKRFRFYSIGTALILILFGVWAFLDVPRIAAGLPTPWVGIRERINIYVFLLWVVVLAIIHLRAGKGQDSINGSHS